MLEVLLEKSLAEEEKEYQMISQIIKKYDLPFLEDEKTHPLEKLSTKLR